MTSTRMLLIGGLIVLGACSVAGWPRYSPADKSYAVSYRVDMTVLENQDLSYHDTDLKGTSFLFPSDTGSGTVLLEARVDSAVGTKEQCIQTGSASTLAGLPATLWRWSDVGAGNLYQGTSVETLKDSRCYRLTLFVHTCNLGPDCYAGRTAPFDATSLEPVFETIRKSFQILG